MAAIEVLCAQHLLATAVRKAVQAELFHVLHGEATIGVPLLSIHDELVCLDVDFDVFNLDLREDCVLR